MTVRFFDFSLSNDEPRGILEAALATSDVTVINTLNAHSFNVSLQDEEFRHALLASDTLVADGVGVVWAARILGARNLGKIAGYDLFEAAMVLADRDRLTVGFLGSTQDVLDKIRARAEIEFPRITLKFLSPPFADEFSDAEATNMVGQLGRVDILCVGMTAPKQEKFVQQTRDCIAARAVLSIGAVFDFYAGTVNRPHPILIRFGLEWLGRAIADPKRLGKRSLIGIPRFALNVLRLSIRR